MLQPSLHAPDYITRTKSREPELTINLTEPAVFIPTYTHKSAVLRGSCELKIKETLMVKKLTVNFSGVSHVHWPHGKESKMRLNKLLYDKCARELSNRM